VLKLVDKRYTYGRQLLDEEDIASVVSILRSAWLTQGATVGEFEQALAFKLGSSCVAAVSSGTAALHLLALALGWQKGDVVITSPLTFLATVNCIVYAGANPEFADIDRQSYTLDPEKLEEKIKSLRKQGRSLRAVIGVDFAGHPCDWKSLRILSSQYDFRLINDCCHALGACYGEDAGYAARYADAAVLSFHPVKHITTGEGGAVITNDREIDQKIRLLRTHGMTKEHDKLHRYDGPWYYEMHDLGFNYRITDIQCALGLSQLRKLDRFLRRRREIARFYDNAFGSNDKFTIPREMHGVSHAYHLYPLQVNLDNVGITKGELFRRFSEQGIDCQVHYIPVHLQPYYRKTFGFSEGSYPIAEDFYRREVSIPMHPGLDNQDLEYISSTILNSF
jgi:UDP-4-amino-4,6-dideoxy-N-acetyl-beta-L-altrosamine transaminase